MDIIIAIGHLVGAYVATAFLGLALASFGVWVFHQSQEQIAQETAIALGVPVADLDNEEVVPKVIELSATRYSSELLRNRLSDLCGTLGTVWMRLGSIGKMGILLAVAWYTFTDSLDDAAYAWLIVPFALFVWIVAGVFALLCKFLTGRYPGQASNGRKVISEIIRERAARALG